MRRSLPSDAAMQAKTAKSFRAATPTATPFLCLGELGALGVLYVSRTYQGHNVAVVVSRGARGETENL